MDSSSSHAIGTDSAVNPFIQATDEFLQEQVKNTYCRRFKEAMAKYYPDSYYNPPIEFLRACWEDANAEWANRPKRVDYEVSVQWQFRQYIEEAQEQLAQEIWENSPEYKAQQEAERLQQEKLKAEREANIAVWEENRRRRRLHDMGIPQRNRYNTAVLCHEAEDYHWEFFEQFFSKAYCGWIVQYDPIWKGYWFPKEAGEISDLFFSTTGTIFLTDGIEKGERYSESNYVWIYGVLVCGYESNSMDHMSPNDYRRAVHGFAAWLAREKGKKEGTILEPGTFNYWERFYNHVTVSMFDERLDENAQCTFRDSPRNIYRRIINYWSAEENALFPELATEKTFKEFLRACLEGGEHHERSSKYFHVRNAGRKNVEKFEITFNSECVPAPEMTPAEDEKLWDYTAGFMKGSSLAHTAVPPKENIKARLQREYEMYARAYENGEMPLNDDCAQAEADAERQD